MAKKLQFPVAKMREDGTPAIWLTSTHWNIVRSGIIRYYLEEREYFGRRRARQDARKEFGPDWRQAAHLKDWDQVDTFARMFSSESQALELYRVGWQAHEVRLDGKVQAWTPGELIEHGDKHEKQGYAEEVERLKEKAAAAVPAQEVAA